MDLCFFRHIEHMEPFCSSFRVPKVHGKSVGFATVVGVTDMTLMSSKMPYPMFLKRARREVGQTAPSVRI